ncbi:threonine/serine exporter family protein [Nonomuraea sp. NBC_01738]|uniref:threonine/serine ThrE exporter family protein n=1 Tax=Nonomuraea sp. NBC_01738 TaxID=2976003 RepID=UPI002E0D3262|nr:threonine/serine exporter family protein [Nonomuraea sp. NBC_01738]
MTYTASEADGHRAMALALRVGELLLGSGEATENVAGAMRRILEAYGLRHVEADVNLSAITLSHVPDDGRAAATAERRVRRRQPDYDRLIAVHELVGEITSADLTLAETQDRLREITRRVKVYPGWAVVCSLALISASAAVLIGGGPTVAAAAFVATILGDRAGAWLARRGVAEFFQLALAASFGALIAMLLLWREVPVEASAVVVGAVIALLPGRPLVACIQDGIAGEYVTATARLTEVVFIVAAVISGIGAVLTVAVALGVHISVDNVPTAPLSLRAPQILGAVGVSLTFAVALLVPPRHLLPGALGGGVIWASFVLLTWQGLATLPATAVAAAFIGLLGTWYARLVGVPSMVFVIPSIGPLLPGSALYKGMLELSLGELSRGTLHLIEALSLALGIGAGVILGAEVLRAFRGRGLARRMRPASRRTRGY